MAGISRTTGQRRKDVSSVARVHDTIFRSTSFEDKLVLTRDAILAMDRHLQDHSSKPEAGGQLFARFEEGAVVVCKCTEPHPEDRRSLFSFLPSRKRERSEISLMYQRGLHYVGDWHTHPEAFPIPSSTDTATMRRLFTQSRHQLSHFILIIRGTAELPSGIWISAHDHQQHTRLITN